MNELLNKYKILKKEFDYLSSNNHKDTIEEELIKYINWFKFSRLFNVFLIIFFSVLFSLSFVLDVKFLIPILFMLIAVNFFISVNTFDIFLKLNKITNKKAFNKDSLVLLRKCDFSFVFFFVGSISSLIAFLISFDYSFSIMLSVLIPSILLCVFNHFSYKKFKNCEDGENKKDFEAVSAEIADIENKVLDNKKLSAIFFLGLEDSKLKENIYKKYFNESAEIIAMEFIKKQNKIENL